MVNTCRKNNEVITDQRTSLYATSGCQGGGNNGAYLCDMYQPVPVSETQSYGFAIQVTGRNNVGDNPNCCKCYDVAWVTGPAADRNKSMIVQIVTPGGDGGDVKVGDLILLVPGGGLGPLDSGCKAQYGNNVNL